MSTPASEPPRSALAERGQLARLVQRAESALVGQRGEPYVPPSTRAARDVRQALEAALAHSSLLPASLQDADVVRLGGMAKYLLHSSRIVTIFTTVMASGTVLPVHDHGSWGMVGVLRGCEEEITYAPAGVGSVPGVTALAEIRRRVLGPGSVSTIRPAETDIHQVVNRGDRNSASIHIFLDDPVSRGFRWFSSAHIASDTGPLRYDQLPQELR